MKNLLILSLFLFKITSAQSLSNERAEDFIDALLKSSDNLVEFVENGELALSQRLGISYTGVKFKSLISLNIDETVKRKILKGKLNYEYGIKNLDGNYSKLLFKIPAESIELEYIFEGSKMVSKPSYYSRNWDLFESKFFVFHASDSSLLNDYSIAVLDSFVEKMLVVLECSDSDMNKLEEEKIHYFLCKNKSEIKELTGYEARGLYYTANDFIISTFNCHYHEIVHLLMNYSLKEVELYTLPLLQEGFAVAFGGRGGKEPDVILNMGRCLFNSGFLNYDMLLRKEDFYQLNASLSYPSAGLYVMFLIETVGMAEFIRLYRKYSSGAEIVNKMEVSRNELPEKTVWNRYLHSADRFKNIRVSGWNENEFQKCFEKKGIQIYDNDKEYLIKIKDRTGFRVKDIFDGYESKLFYELFPSKKYKNQKYVIKADAAEVSVYNLYKNNLAAKYVMSFTENNKPVPKEDGFFVFAVKKDVFDEDLKAMDILLF